MTERTITIAQRCTDDETAAMVAAIRAYEDKDTGARRALAVTAGASGLRAPAGPVRPARRDGVGVLWTRSDPSPGRVF